MHYKSFFALAAIACSSFCHAQTATSLVGDIDALTKQIVDLGKVVNGTSRGAIPSNVEAIEKAYDDIITAETVLAYQKTFQGDATQFTESEQKSICDSHEECTKQRIPFLEAFLPNADLFKVFNYRLANQIKSDDQATDSISFGIRGVAPDCKRAGEQELRDKFNKALKAYDA